jgi:hypothetical protein
MLRRITIALVASWALAAMPLVAHADTNTSSNTAASTLQPTPSDSVQMGANQSPTASADALSNQLVGGPQSMQGDSSANPPSPWRDILAVGLLAVGLIGLITILYWGRRKPAAAVTVVEPPVISKSKAKAKAKAQRKRKKK